MLIVQWLDNTNGWGGSFALYVNTLWGPCWIAKLGMYLYLDGVINQLIVTCGGPLCIDLDTC